MSRWLLCFAIVAVGCAVNNRRSEVPIVDGQSGFWITAVDGKAPKRNRHPYHTVIPYVLVEPGEHTFTGKYDDGTLGEATSTVELGKSYRTSLPNEPFGVVEGDASVAHHFYVRSPDWPYHQHAD